MTRIHCGEIRRLYKVPEHIGVVSALAIGYVPDENHATAGAWPPPHRSRKPLKTFVFTGTWSQAWSEADRASKVDLEMNETTVAA